MQYPLDLQIEGKVYALTGTICHEKNHFEAFVKSAADGKWQHYDDSVSQPTTIDEVLRLPNPYLLFYTAREVVMTDSETEIELETKKKSSEARKKEVKEAKKTRTRSQNEKEVMEAMQSRTRSQKVVKEKER